jgi:hypothetical protein
VTHLDKLSATELGPRGRKMMLGVLLLAAVIVAVFWPYKSNAQALPVEAICDWKKAPQLSQADIQKMGLSQKLHQFRETLPKVLETPKFGVVVIVIACHDTEGAMVDKVFDESSGKPVLKSATVYVTAEVLKSYGPN